MESELRIKVEVCMNIQIASGESLVDTSTTEMWIGYDILYSCKIL